MYLIWSNEHNAWWRPDGKGYTRVIENAGRYSREDAMKISRGLNFEGWNYSRIPDELPILEADAIELASGE